MRRGRGPFLNAISSILTCTCHLTARVGTGAGDRDPSGKNSPLTEVHVTRNSTTISSQFTLYVFHHTYALRFALPLHTARVAAPDPLGRAIRREPDKYSAGGSVSSRQQGRPERPVDPDAGPSQRFAHELRSLRARSGSPSYRAMSERSGVSVAALARAASGERLPSVTVVRAYAQACGADPDLWEKWLGRVADEVAVHGAENGESPYQGLARFEPGDRELFFGRDGLAEDVVRLMKEHPFTVLLGASGSGKSSLLRAGVMPRMAKEEQEAGSGARLRLITPGARPATAHVRMLIPDADQPHRIVVVDQFEEIFTLCRNRDERWLFVDQLLAARHSGGRLRVVVAVGSGFHARCAEHQNLAEAMQHASLTVRPMTREELRDAVVKPATAAGLRVERELTARIVEDVHDRPGALPMLSHVLRETWRRRRSGVLTLAAYEEAGGVHGAIAAAAEDVYGRLSPEQADAARRFLLALIAPGDGTPDSSRPVRRADLREWPDPEVPFVLQRFSRARLVTVDTDHVELAHDALITGWPRLQEWIEESRERVRMRRHLAEAARNWLEHGRDPGALYRGIHLALADVLFTRDVLDDDLNARERAFLSASRVAQRMERCTADRMRRRIRRLVVALVCVLCGALVAGRIAWYENGVAEHERSVAEARQAADLAGRDRVTDPRARTLLSIAAWRLAVLPESRAALLTALTDPERDAFTVPDQNDGTRDFLADSGLTLLDVGGGRWSAWDVVTHRRTGSGQLPDLPVTAVSRDGRTLALAEVDGSQRLWHLPPVANVRAGEQELGGRRAPDASATGVGGYIESGPDPARQLRAFTDDPVVLRSATGVVVPSTDGRLTAICSQHRPLSVRDIVHHHTVPGTWEQSAVSNCASASVVLDRAGTRLAAISESGIRVWDTASGRQLESIAQRGAALLAFTPDGRFLAVAGQDATTVWRLPKTPAPMPTPVFRWTSADGPVTALAWDPDTPTLRCLAGGTVHSLDLSAPLTSPWLARPADHETFSPHGMLLATAERNDSRFRFRLRDTRTGRVVGQPPAIRVPTRSTSADVVPLMAFSPDGRAFAYGIGGPEGSDTRLVVWNVTADRVQASLRPDGSSAVRSIALTSGGKRLLLSRATSADSLTGEVWNTDSGTRTHRPAALATALKSALDAGFAGPATSSPFGVHIGALDSDRGTDILALGPGGVHRAIGDDLGNITVWNGRDEHRQDAILPPGAGTTYGARVSALAFSPDGTTLAVGYASGALFLWDTASRQPIGGSLDTLGDAIRSLAFGAGGSLLYVGSDHVPVRRFAVGSTLVVAQLCERAGRDLTADEWRTYLPEVPYQRLCDPPGLVDQARDFGPAPAGTSAATPAQALRDSAKHSALRPDAEPFPGTPQRASTSEVAKEHGRARTQRTAHHESAQHEGHLGTTRHSKSHGRASTARSHGPEADRP
ncbi:helix-turn-helix domain-containing protein [Streptomyces sp. NPDC058457]|uniref:nSTAND1 domain-containing NTPase n=1 Tax=Streptomyces sp. NPDC058457 TaxID=3346507 RepID=UPI003654F4DA